MGMTEVWKSRETPKLIGAVQPSTAVTRISSEQYPEIKLHAYKRSARSGLLYAV